MEKEGIRGQFKLNTGEPKAKVILQDSDQSYNTVKRIIDILLSVLGIITLLPVFILVIAAIKLESPKGSVFFKQKRVGENERIFYMYKFRSMVPDAEKLLIKLKNQNEVGSHMFKMKQDPRITRVGHFIRKTSIDELPQLLNVIKGEMSLVGPRPPLVNEYVEYSDYHKIRLSVPQGCTGLWQVSGRSEIGFEEMVKLDIKYIHERSLKNDLRIIFLTFAVVITGKGAY